MDNGEEEKIPSQSSRKKGKSSKGGDTQELSNLIDYSTLQEESKEDQKKKSTIFKLLARSKKASETGEFTQDELWELIQGNLDAKELIHTKEEMMSIVDRLERGQQLMMTESGTIILL